MRPTAPRWLRPLALCLLISAPPLAGVRALAQLQRFDQHRLVRVTLETQADLDKMLAISGDHWSESLGLGQIVFRVAPESLPALRDSGLAHQIVLDDLQTLLDREQAALQLRGGGWFDNYKTYAEINAYLDTLVALRPDLVTKFTVGQSLEGRTIYGVRVSGSLTATRPGILFNGGQHAREWISPMTMMYIADRLVRDYDTNAAIREALDKLTFFIVPLVNPDGYVYTWSTNRLWRKNRRANSDGSFGVDLNRNWSVGFGGPGSSGTPSNDTYRGTAAFSEPESAALRDFVLAHPEIVTHIDFHSFSQLILSPYGYSTSEPAEPDGPTFRDINARMAAAIAAVHGQTYEAGPTGATLYVASGVMSDWTYENRGIWGWGVELRDTGLDGFVLPADQIIPTGEENFALTLALADVFEDTLQIRQPLPAPQTTLSSAPRIDLDIAPLYDTLDPASPQLFWRVAGGAAFAALPLSAAGGVAHFATLPSVPCGRTIEFYAQAADSSGRTVTAPDAGGAAPFTIVATDLSTLFADQMENGANGWSVGDVGDNASAGVWSLSDPQPTAAQPADDHTPGSGVNCWVTDGRSGTSLGQFDVDGGKTTLKTPAINLGSASDPRVSYWRWYSNSAGSAPNADTFRIDIAPVGGAWVNVETVGPAGAQAAGGWYFHEFRVRDLLPALPASFTLRFVAEDIGSGSVVEAAIDDFLVVDQACPPQPCVGDLTGDQRTDSSDLGALLSSWLAGPGGDLNGDQQTDSGDLGILLADWLCGAS